MRKRKVLIVFVLFLLVSFITSCRFDTSSITGLLSKDSATSTVTATFTPLPAYNTITPTNTPLPTNTPMPTPTPAVFISPCATLEDCPYAGSIRDFVPEDADGGSVLEARVPFDTPLFIYYGWVALDDATLEQNMKEMKFFFEIDGNSYLNEADIKTSYTPDANDPSLIYSSVSLGYILENWKIDEPHTVRIGFRFENEVFDGWETYPAGTTFENTFSVIPVPLPTATPTTAPTSTYIPQPTAVPLTPTVACELGTTINIKNDTGGQVTMYLTGPAKYTFYIAAGTRTLELCSGNYSYTAYGCGGASTSGSAGDGDEIEFWCE